MESKSKKSSDYPVTPESICLAKERQDLERREFERLTGARLDEDGRIWHGIRNGLAVSAVLWGLMFYGCAKLHAEGATIYNLHHCGF